MRQPQHSARRQPLALAPVAAYCGGCTVCLTEGACNCCAESRKHGTQRLCLLYHCSNPHTCLSSLFVLQLLLVLVLQQRLKLLPVCIKLGVALVRQLLDALLQDTQQTSGYVGWDITSGRPARGFLCTCHHW